MGNRDRLGPGDSQFIRAGRGMLHAEQPQSGRHGLQLWTALPPDQKLVEPAYASFRAAAIPEIDPRDALARQHIDALLIDVREDDERGGGSPAGAIGVARDDLSNRIGGIAPDPRRGILTICASGKRSLLAARTLRDMGYADVASVRGGFARWRQEGLPVDEGEIDRLPELRAGDGGHVVR